MEIPPAQVDGEYAQARTLFLEYADWLGFDLCYQNFDEEVEKPREMYSPPNGNLLLAWDGKNLAGCVAVRKLDVMVSEMKRLYIRPFHRGKGLGKKLVDAILKAAKDLGYRAMRLDTLPAMEQAISIYQARGFKPIPPYYENPIEGAMYMELRW